MKDGQVSVGLTAAEFGNVKKQLEAVYSKLGNVEKRVQTAVRVAVNSTAKKIKVQVSRQIREKVLIKKKQIDPYIKVKPAYGKAVPTAMVILSKSKRLPLRFFNPIQRKSGVSFRIEKDKAAGHGVVFGAYILNRTGKKEVDVWVRDFDVDGAHNAHYKKSYGGNKRSPRYPQHKLYGPSPWGVYVISGMRTETISEGQALLRKQLMEQLRVAGLRASGVISSGRGFKRK
jgi:hypothetical protein